MGQQPHILVVDDHAEIRERITRFLHRNGLRATAAKDAVEMDACLAAGHSALMVLALTMLGADRLTVLRRPPPTTA